MTTPASAPATAPAPVRRGTARRLVGNPVGAASAIVLAAIVLCAIAAPLLTPYAPGDSALRDVLAEPGAAHPLGADGSGRDIWTQLLYGARQSLLAGIIATAVAIIIGVPAGLVSGYRGRRLDTALSWVSDLVMSLPAIIVLLAVISRTGPVMPVIMVAFGLLTAPFFYRITRSSTLAVRNELFVDAAQVAGLSPLRILARHVLPTVRGPILIQGALVLGMAIVAQAGLEFLGLGDPSTPSWGTMLNDALRNIYVAPQLILFPGLALGITSCALALLGAALNDTLSRRDTGAVRPAGRRAPRAASTPAVPTSTPASVAALAGLSPAATAGAALVIDDLRVSYGATEVVHGVSFTVQPGEVVGLVGESGSGKTQVALASLGLLPDTARPVLRGLGIDGVDATGFSDRDFRRVRGTRIAYIPQEPLSNLDPAFTVGYQLIEPMRHHLKISKAEASAKAVALLARVGIVEPGVTMARYPHQLSGGMAQRVLIAAAVSCDPALLIADEPTTALDVTVQAEVLDLLRDLQRERRMAILIVTHNFGVVADLCDRVLVMRSGEVVEQGSAATILTAPQHEYTRALLGASLDSAPSRRDRDRARSAAFSPDSTLTVSETIHA